MRKWFYRAGLILLGWAVTGCGKKCYEPSALQPFGNPASAADMPFDSSVPSDQQASIRRDFERLASLALPKAEKDDQCILGVRDTSASTLTSWFKTRVKLIVGEGFDYKSNRTASAPERGSSPAVLANEMVDPDSLGAVVTVMFNLGSFLYLSGKQSGQIYTLNVDSNSYRVTSPRVGIVQIGEGMFTANRVSGSAQDSTANSFLRLAVMFHEARHSDGHGDNAAFPHAKCESGDYRGNHACEENLNGPYAVQAHLVKRFLQICTDCTATEKEAMMRLMADYRSRLSSGAEYRDDRPEGFR